MAALMPQHHKSDKQRPNTLESRFIRMLRLDRAFATLGDLGIPVAKNRSSIEYYSLVACVSLAKPMMSLPTEYSTSGLRSRRGLVMTQSWPNRPQHSGNRH